MMKLTTLLVALGVALPAAAVDLSTALSSAQAADPTLGSALANRDAAAENIPIARARLLPQLSLQSTDQQLRQSTATSLGPSEFDGRTASKQLSFRQALFRPRDWAGLTIGKLQAEYGEYKLVTAQADLWNRTVTAWIDVLGAVALRDAYARAVASAQAAADQEKKRFQGGDGTRDAMAEAAAQAAQARAQLADAEVALQARRVAFQLLTRLEATGFEAYRMPDPSGLVLAVESEQSAVQRVLDMNPDLMGARASEMISERKVSQASSDHLPTLDMIGSVAEAKNDSPTSLGTRYRNKQLGLQLVIPIFQGGGVVASVRQATDFYTAAVSDREALEQKLRTQVSGDWGTMVGLRERIGAAQELVAAAREQRRAAQSGIRVGVKTWSDAGAADQLVARRETDLIGLVTNFVKIQARILSLLPIAAPEWDQWTRSLWVAVQK